MTNIPTNFQSKSFWVFFPSNLEQSNFFIHTFLLSSKEDAVSEVLDSGKALTRHVGMEKALCPISRTQTHSCAQAHEHTYINTDT